MTFPFPVFVPAGGYTRSGLQLYLDAGISSSYPGSGQSFDDISGNNYDYYLGSGSGSGADDPTYNAGPPPYFSVDGADWFSPQVVGSGGFMNRIGRSDQPFTWEMFVYVVNASTSYMGVSTSGGAGNGAIISFTSTERFSYDATPSRNTLIGTNAANVNAWNQVAFTGQIDGSTTCTQYLNGAANGSSTIANTWNSGNSNQGMGIFGLAAFSGFAASGYRFGLIRIYNRVLTSGEVLQNYNADKARFGL